jgi:hypothetical protein
MSCLRILGCWPKDEPLHSSPLSANALSIDLPSEGGDPAFNDPPGTPESRESTPSTPDDTPSTPNTIITSSLAAVGSFSSSPGSREGKRLSLGERKQATLIKVVNPMKMDDLDNGDEPTEAED